MAFFDYSDKAAAERAQRMWERTAAKLSILTSILGGVPDAALSAHVAGTLTLFSGYLAIDAGHAAADPPRSDFMRQTRVGRPRRDPRRVHGKTDLDEGALRLSTDLSDCVSFLRATVRAAERADAAEQIAANQLAQERLMEARRNRRRTAEALSRTADTSWSFAQQLEAQQLIPRGGLLQPLALGARRLADPLVEAGYSIGHAVQAVAGELDAFTADPDGDLTRSTLDAARATEEFSRELGKHDADPTGRRSLA